MKDPQDTSGNFTINPADAFQTATDKLATKPLPDIQEPGKGEVNNASTWDEFPNGRFGDYKSPAFGLQSDPWNSGVGNSLAISVCIPFFSFLFFMPSFSSLWGI